MLKHTSFISDLVGIYNLSVFIRAGEPEPEPEPGVFGSWEPEPLKKNQEPESEPLRKKSGAGAALQPCEKIKSIRKLYFSSVIV